MYLWCSLGLLVGARSIQVPQLQLQLQSQINRLLLWKIRRNRNAYSSSGPLVRCWGGGNRRLFNSFLFYTKMCQRSYSKSRHVTRIVSFRGSRGDMWLVNVVLRCRFLVCWLRISSSSSSWPIRLLGQHPLTPTTQQLASDWVHFWHGSAVLCSLVSPPLLWFSCIIVVVLWSSIDIMAKRYDAY